MNPVPIGTSRDQGGSLAILWGSREGSRRTRGALRTGDSGAPGLEWGRAPGGFSGTAEGGGSLGGAG